MPSVSTNAPAITNFIRGDARLLLVPAYEADGQTPFDLTGCTVFFTLNASESPPSDGTDDTAIIKKSVNSGFVDVYVSPDVNLPQADVPYIAQIQLLNTDTKSLSPEVYNYDIQLVDSYGNPSSLGQNTWEVIDDISTRVS